MPQSQRLLVKLRPQTALGVASAKANLRRQFDAADEGTALGMIAATPAWYLADVEPSGPNASDAAHNQVAQALGLDSSTAIFAEPDLPQKYPDSNEANTKGPYALSPQNCAFTDQENGNRSVGPRFAFAWHLLDNYSELASAHDAVKFTADPYRTRIARIDTGYDPNHVAKPTRVLRNLERMSQVTEMAQTTRVILIAGFRSTTQGSGTGIIGILHRFSE